MVDYVHVALGFDPWDDKTNTIFCWGKTTPPATASLAASRPGLNERTDGGSPVVEEHCEFSHPSSGHWPGALQALVNGTAF